MAKELQNLTLPPHLPDPLAFLSSGLSLSLTYALTSPVSSYKDAVLLCYVSGSLPPLLDAKGKEPGSGRASCCPPSPQHFIP